MFEICSELYGDINTNGFDGFWPFYEAKQGLVWRKVVGDDIITVHLSKFINEGKEVLKVNNIVISQYIIIKMLLPMLRIVRRRGAT